MDPLEWILAAFSFPSRNQQRQLHTTGTPQIPDMVDGKAAENYRFTHNTDWHKEQMKIFC